MTADEVKRILEAMYADGSTMTAIAIADSAEIPRRSIASKLAELERRGIVRSYEQPAPVRGYQVVQRRADAPARRWGRVQNKL